MKMSSLVGNIGRITDRIPPVSQKIRILFATPMLDRGGPDRVLFEILRRMDRSRFAPSLMVNQPTGHYLSRLPPDIPIEVLGPERSTASRYPVIPALRHVWRTRPDIVFTTLRMNLTFGLLAPFLPRRVRLVVRPASPVTADTAALVEQSVIKHRIARRLLLATLRRADGVICQSAAMRDDLSTGADASNLHVVGNPIDVDEVARLSGTASVQLEGTPALVSVGRLVPLKGYDIALHALSRLRQTHPAIHLTIIGDGPERTNLETLAQDLDLRAHVTFVGYSHAPLPYVRGADLFLLTSRYDAFCNATLEALACGTPIVVTDCPGANAELVREGVNGRLVPTLDPDDVVRAVNLALADRFDREAIRADCRARYASDKIVRAYEDVLEAVANS